MIVTRHRPPLASLLTLVLLAPRALAVPAPSLTLPRKRGREKCGALPGGFRHWLMRPVLALDGSASAR